MRMSATAEDVSNSRKDLFPEFVADGIDVMAQDDVVIGVAVGKLKLIVQLQNELCRIQWTGAVTMHREVGHRLIGEKIWRATQVLKPFDG
jgi:hypothetical protein